MEIVAKLKAAARIRSARMRLVAREPFYGSLVLNFRLKESGRVSTLWTNGDILEYNPLYIARLDDDELEGVLAHEAEHCALKHNLRRGDRDVKRWNIATDYVINRDLINSGFKLPEGAYDDPRYDRYTAEEIYDLLPDEEPKKKKGKDGEQQPQKGAGASGAGGKGKPDKDGEKQKGGKGKGGEKPESGDEEPQEGSGSAGHGEEPDDGEPDEKDGGGAQEQFARPEDDPGMCGSIGDPADEEEAAAIGKQWDESVKDAEALTRMIDPGKLPASMRREEAAVFEKPRVDWRALLRKFIDRAVARDYSFSRPNRRHIASDILMPGRVPDNPSHIVAIIDTSGSINAATLAMFRQQLQDMLDDNAMDKLTIACADTQVYRDKVESFKPGEIVDVKKYGGGGTDFADAMRWASGEIGEDVTAIVYLTDMATSNFGDPKEIPVLWAIGGSDRKSLESWASRSTFGEKIWLVD